MGRLDQARAALAEAAELERSTKVEWMKAEIQRLESNLELSKPIPNREIAEAKLLGAIAAARSNRQDGGNCVQPSASLRHWTNAGERHKSCDLTPIYSLKVLTRRT
jgi:hypothetical protein